MMIVVVLFYPAFEFLNRWSNSLVEKSIDVSANVLGRKNALIIVALLLLFVLYTGFLFLWFHKSLFSDVIRAVQKSLFFR
jgi:disulfide bond formation protein DsbB